MGFGQVDFVIGRFGNVKFCNFLNMSSGRQNETLIESLNLLRQLLHVWKFGKKDENI